MYAILYYLRQSCLLRFFCVQAEDGIRVLVRSRGLGDVYKRQPNDRGNTRPPAGNPHGRARGQHQTAHGETTRPPTCLLYTSDAADERSSVDLGGRRIIKKKTQHAVKIQTLLRNYRERDCMSQARPQNNS